MEELTPFLYNPPSKTPHFLVNQTKFCYISGSPKPLMGNSVKHLVILLSFFLLSSFLTSCEKKEGKLYYHSSPLFFNEKGVMTKDNYGWKGFVQKDKKEWIQSYEGQVMKEFSFFGDFIPHGFGVEKIDNQIVYVGEWKNGKYHGQGTDTNTFFGKKYVGEHKDGRKNGQGTETYLDGRKYEGEWKDGKKDGHGILIFPDGRKYVGVYKRGRIWNGQWNGQDTDSILSTGKYGGRYEGEYKNGKEWNGIGYYKNGKIKYKYVNGIPIFQ